MIGKSLVILFLVCLFCNSTYGSELLVEEAFNHYREGLKAQKMGDFYNAQTNYQKSILLDAKYKKYIFNNLGVLHTSKGEMKEAEIKFKEALKIDPYYNVAIVNLSILYFKLSIFYKNKGDTKKALENLEKAFYYYPEKTFILEEREDINGNDS